MVTGEGQSKIDPKGTVVLLVDWDHPYISVLHGAINEKFGPRVNTFPSKEGVEKNLSVESKIETIFTRENIEIMAQQGPIVVFLESAANYPNTPARRAVQFDQDVKEIKKRITSCAPNLSLEFILLGSGVSYEPSREDVFLLVKNRSCGYLEENMYERALGYIESILSEQ